LYALLKIEAYITIMSLKM